MKKMLTAIGFLTIVGQSSLTVVTCDFKQIKQKSEHISAIVVSAINRINDCQLNVAVNTKISDLKSLVTVEFVKKQLNEAVKNLFDKNLFVLNKIINCQGIALSNDDLKNFTILKAKVNYDYAEFKDQNISLLINIQSNQIIK